MLVTVWKNSIYALYAETFSTSLINNIKYICILCRLHSLRCTILSRVMNAEDYFMKNRSRLNYITIILSHPYGEPCNFFEADFED